MLNRCSCWGRRGKLPPGAGPGGAGREAERQSCHVATIGGAASLTRIVLLLLLLLLARHVRARRSLRAHRDLVKLGNAIIHCPAPLMQRDSDLLGFTARESSSENGSAIAARRGSLHSQSQSSNFPRPSSSRNLAHLPTSFVIDSQEGRADRAGTAIGRPCLDKRPCGVGACEASLVSTHELRLERFPHGLETHKGFVVRLWASRSPACDMARPNPGPLSPLELEHMTLACAELHEMLIIQDFGAPQANETQIRPRKLIRD